MFAIKLRFLSRREFKNVHNRWKLWVRARALIWSVGGKNVRINKSVNKSYTLTKKKTDLLKVYIRVSRASLCLPTIRCSLHWHFLTRHNRNDRCCARIVALMACTYNIWSSDFRKRQRYECIVYFWRETRRITLRVWKMFFV